MIDSRFDFTRQNCLEGLKELTGKFSSVESKDKLRYKQLSRDVKNLHLHARYLRQKKKEKRKRFRRNVRWIERPRNSGLITKARDFSKFVLVQRSQCKLPLKRLSNYAPWPVIIVTFYPPTLSNYPRLEELSDLSINFSVTAYFYRTRGTTTIPCPPLAPSRREIH